MHLSSLYEVSSIKQAASDRLVTIETIAFPPRCFAYERDPHFIFIYVDVIIDRTFPTSSVHIKLSAIDKV